MYNDKSIPESQLISILANKSNEIHGFRILYDMYAGALLGVISGIIPDIEEAEDVLQECMLKIWTTRKTYDPAKERALTWMLKITRKQAIDSYRSKKLRRHNLTYESRTGAGTTDNRAPQIRDAQFNDLNRLKDRIGTNLFNVMDIIYFKGFTSVDAAIILDLTVSTVKIRLRQAIQELRNDLLK